MAALKSKRERLNFLADAVGQMMGLTLEVRGPSDRMLVVEVDEVGEVVSHPFGFVGRPAAEVKAGLRFAAMAMQRMKDEVRS
jgi:hypothetical protein